MACGQAEANPGMARPAATTRASLRPAAAAARWGGEDGAENGQGHGRPHFEQDLPRQREHADDARTILRVAPVAIEAQGAQLLHLLLVDQLGRRLAGVLCTGRARPHEDEAGEHEGQEAMDRLHCNIGTWAPTREFPCKQKNRRRLQPEA
jgi:hypothetical protein